MSQAGRSLVGLINDIGLWGEAGTCNSVALTGSSGVECPKNSEYGIFHGAARGIEPRLGPKFPGAFSIWGWL